MCALPPQLTISVLFSFQFQDVHNWAFATLYFVIFTIIGAFFLLQFVFAVIWERFNAVNDGTAENWDLILEERKSSVKVQVAPKASERERNPVPGRIQDQKAGFRASFRNNLNTTILMIVKKKGPIERLRGMCQDIVKVRRTTWMDDQFYLQLTDVC